jgi:hypothetical protein
VIDREDPHPLRLRKRHGEGRKPGITVEDGARIVRAQSLRNATVVSMLVLIIFCAFWIGVSALTDRVFAWMTVVFGGLLGIAIRMTGRGVDWRFPTLAGGVAFAGSVISNIVLAASTTAAEYGTGTLQVLRAVTSMTWPVFFDEVWNVADGFFAIMAAALAAFLAPRRLTRSQRYAVRLFRERPSDRHQ